MYLIIVDFDSIQNKINIMIFLTHFFRPFSFCEYLTERVGGRNVRDGDLQTILFLSGRFRLLTIRIRILFKRSDFCDFPTPPAAPTPSGFITSFIFSLHQDDKYSRLRSKVGKVLQTECRRANAY